MSSTAHAERDHAASVHDHVERQRSGAHEAPHGIKAELHSQIDEARKGGSLDKSPAHDPVTPKSSEKDHSSSDKLDFHAYGDIYGSKVDARHSDSSQAAGFDTNGWRAANAVGDQYHAGPQPYGGLSQFPQGESDPNKTNPYGSLDTKTNFPSKADQTPSPYGALDPKAFGSPKPDDKAPTKPGSDQGHNPNHKVADTVAIGADQAEKAADQKAVDAGREVSTAGNILKAMQVGSRLPLVGDGIQVGGIVAKGVNGKRDEVDDDVARFTVTKFSAAACGGVAAETVVGAVPAAVACNIGSGIAYDNLKDGSWTSTTIGKFLGGDYANVVSD